VKLSLARWSVGKSPIAVIKKLSSVMILKSRLDLKTALSVWQERVFLIA